MQHLVSSLSVSGRPVHRLRENSTSLVIPDGCIILIQGYFDVLVLIHLVCLLCITDFYVLLTVHLSIILDNDQLDTHLIYFSI